MWQYVLKIALTTAVVIAVSEIAKRSTLWGAVLASLPLTSLLAFVWLYLDSGNSESVAALSLSIFWLVLPSLLLFLMLPWLIRSGLSFWPSLAAACTATVAAYFVMIWILQRFDVRL
jgi:hypothetical protein